ncbi:glycosyltransferase family 1 protein [Streptomyces sp. R302]|nr:MULTISPECIES: glycosyltransferase [unclassified Streptomyces]NML51794.1 glycosyltransferase family 1 protein [Streptomyces sp. R301]NML81414.1 glycosyltransferase family 1 protein [Streptomyces sp. R302]
MTAGSRGDVSPYTGLGAGLVRAGHEVTLAAHAVFEPLVAGSGVRFRPLPVDPRAELHSARGRRLHDARTGAGKLVRLASMARGAVDAMTAALVDVAREGEVLLVGGALGPLGYAIAEGLDVPAVGLHLQPLHPTAEFPAPVLGTRSLGAVGNRLSGRAVMTSVELMFHDAVRSLPRRYGLPRAGGRSPAWPVLHGYSELVVPRPRDWAAGLEVSGYWWPHETGRLPRELEDFLAAGPPPVFVGLGSATVPDPERVSGEIVAALRAAKVRGVVQKGWAGLAARGDDILTVDEVPHSLLFPRTAAVVHHAGAGTTGAVLRAGVPTVPVPVQFDAAFWASRLTALGTAPGAVPLRRLTAGNLTVALRRATGDASHRARARALADRLATEDGVAPVLAALDRLGR